LKGGGQAVRTRGRKGIRPGKGGIGRKNASNRRRAGGTICGWNGLSEKAGVLNGGDIQKKGVGPAKKNQHKRIEPLSKAFFGSKKRRHLRRSWFLGQMGGELRGLRAKKNRKEEKREMLFRVALEGARGREEESIKKLQRREGKAL